MVWLKVASALFILSHHDELTMVALSMDICPESSSTTSGCSFMRLTDSDGSPEMLNRYLVWKGMDEVIRGQDECLQRLAHQFMVPPQSMKNSFGT